MNTREPIMLLKWSSKKEKKMVKSIAWTKILILFVLLVDNNIIL